MASSTAARHILVTGGSGYIGSHTVVQLLEAGYTATVVDSLVNSSKASLDRVREIVGEEAASRLNFVQCDLVDKDALSKVFEDNPQGFDACVHFAGLKAVGESVSKPLLYYNNNLTGTFYLVELMQKHGCKNLVFSSSATVYGTSPPPLSETSQVGVGITNPYGQTKYMIECVLKDVCKADPSFGCVILRYFNPVGAHNSGRIGEDPQGIPNNLMPYVQQVAVGRREKLTVFGDDYETPDGTGVRDYIHVVDLAAGHLAALRNLDDAGVGCRVYNLGTGTGYSVLNMVDAMKKASGKDIPYVIGPRRPGDLGSVYADAERLAKNWGGLPNLVSRTCARTHGDGRATTLLATRRLLG